MAMTELKQQRGQETAVMTGMSIHQQWSGSCAFSLSCVSVICSPSSVYSPTWVKTDGISPLYSMHSWPGTDLLRGKAIKRVRVNFRQRSHLIIFLPPVYSKVENLRPCQKLYPDLASARPLVSNRFKG